MYKIIKVLELKHKKLSLKLINISTKRKITVKIPRSIKLSYIYDNFKVNDKVNIRLVNNGIKRNIRYKKEYYMYNQVSNGIFVRS